MPTRSVWWASALLLALGLAVPAAEAQDPGLRFPPAAAGRWEGLVTIAGFLTSDVVADDGSFTTQVIDVIDSTTIAVDLTVDGAGRATGTMTVDLTWFVEAVGTAPTTFEPFRVLHDQHQTGVLPVTGTADRLVAAGSLVWDTNTVAEGDVVEEVSGSETVTVEWVFAAREAVCTRVSGALAVADGSSLVTSVLIPRVSGGDGSEYHNELVGEFLLWPADIEDPEAVREAVEELTRMGDEILEREFPDATHVTQLVAAWEALNAELAALDACQAELVDFVPQATGWWLTTMVSKVLYRALDSIDHYDAADLTALWAAGMEVGAMDGELVVGFLDGFRDQLDRAIAVDDVAEITAVAAFAARYGYPELYQDATSALEAAG